MFTETLGVMIPIVALMIPIVALLTAHQRRMAELIHGSAGSQDVRRELDETRTELAQLRAQVHAQALALESLDRNGPDRNGPDRNGLEKGGASLRSRLG